MHVEIAEFRPQQVLLLEPQPGRVNLSQILTNHRVCRNARLSDASHAFSLGMDAEVLRTHQHVLQ